MRILAALLAVCCLQEAISMRVGEFMQGPRRAVREAGAPAPIECKMSAWSPWKPCDPCTKTMYRSRSIEMFGQFGGQKCIEPIGERKLCKPSTKCVESPPPICSSSEFQCESGLCVKKRLKCNGDNDCGDFSDEEECDTFRRPCGDFPVTESDIGRTTGYGINILGSGPRMNPFNNKVYNGMCERVKDPSTMLYNRLPWNVAVLNYETLVEETTSKEVYEDTHSLISEITKDTTTKSGLELSFKFTPTESSTQETGASFLGSNAGVNTESEKSEMVKAITDYSSTKNKSFLRVKGRVQLGTYRMRSRGLEVSETFLDDVDALPLEYEKSQYFGFLEDYGTHYTKNGKAGGEYDLVYVLNSDVITEKNVLESTLKECLKVGINAGIQIGGVLEVNQGGKTDATNNCDTVTSKTTDSSTSKPVIDKVISAVKGGSTQSAAAMKSQLSKEGVMDRQYYVEWARTLADLPALIYSDPEPIYNAIPLSFPDAQPRRENLQRALQDYVAEYSVCKCQPCQNGGTVAQIDGQCVCLCPLHFEGIACQTIRHDLMKDKDKPIHQQGNWGCWTPWSSCSGGRRTRTRTCRTGDIAESTCKGDTTSEDYC
ncbi:complement component C9 [Electrophorus electricus]|uniref:complement component C9 n=1 Tax=Electrophorus electricus TaxID=8005 RepID=UPI0015D0B8FB|nr:complement component C9 [Electrophorus electricus]